MNNYIKIALPKGRLAKQTLDILQQAGYPIDVSLDTRELVLTDEKNRFIYMLVKPIDVLTYVEEGVCDVGVTGKDVIDESNPDVYELVDMNIGVCKFSVAGKSATKIYDKPVLKVATKYPNVATKYFKEKEQKISIIKLNGSVELAPIIGLSDVIVDIVETGSTLRANDLEVLEDLYRISARLISNKSSYRLRYNEIVAMTERIKGVIWC